VRVALPLVVQLLRKARRAKAVGSHMADLKGKSIKLDTTLELELNDVTGSRQRHSKLR